MTRYHLGEKGQRLRWNFYFFGGLFILIGGGCLICSRADWSFVQRNAFENRLFELEEEIVMTQAQTQFRIRKFIAKCSELLRSRWQTAYLYSEKTDEGYFIGRVPPADFRKAVMDQKNAIHGGKPIDKTRIPKLILALEFERLNCRLIVGDAAPSNP